MQALRPTVKKIDPILLPVFVDMHDVQANQNSQTFPWFEAFFSYSLTSLTGKKVNNFHRFSWWASLQYMHGNKPKSMQLWSRLFTTKINNFSWCDYSPHISYETIKICFKCLHIGSAFELLSEFIIFYYLWNRNSFNLTKLVFACIAQGTLHTTRSAVTQRAVHYIEGSMYISIPPQRVLTESWNYAMIAPFSASIFCTTVDKYKSFIFFPKSNWNK